MLGLQLLVDMVTGQLGDQGEQSGAATISRVLLAGNLLSQSTQDKEASKKVLYVCVYIPYVCMYVVVPTPPAGGGGGPGPLCGVVRLYKE